MGDPKHTMHDTLAAHHLPWSHGYKLDPAKWEHRYGVQRRNGRVQTFQVEAHNHMVQSAVAHSIFRIGHLRLAHHYERAGATVEWFEDTLLVSDLPDTFPLVICDH